ncbi:hypothetical protein GCM10022419_115220 [Nonomuraea rosea]|uniref:DUF308 domain-containing protein n=2 Tax=Nonomuraea rosea TaxID=638574 RepID=A0ABP6ZIZ5_9ACTN
MKGLAALLAGVFVTAWPRITVDALVALAGIQLLVSGTFDLARSIVSRDTSAEARLLFALLGGLLICVGGLALRGDLRTIEVLAVMLGLAWTLTGIIDLVSLLAGPSCAERVPEAVIGVLAALAGIAVLVVPTPPPAASAVFAGLWLMAWGGLTVLVSGGRRRLPQDG